MPTALLIVNPVAGPAAGPFRAGGQRAERLRELAEPRLERAGFELDLRVTEAPGDASDFARHTEAELVLVAGGDGTLMEAVQGLLAAERRVPVAQLPGGTGNLLARALGIPGAPGDAVEVALEGVAAAVDIGRFRNASVDEASDGTGSDGARSGAAGSDAAGSDGGSEPAGRPRAFAVAAGAGWDAQLIRDASRELKDRLGKGAYLMSGLKNLFALEPVDLTVEVDGERHELRGHTAMVLNLGDLADAGLELGDAISPHDGWLDVAVVSAGNPAALARLALELRSGRLDAVDGLTHFRGQRVRVDADPPLEAQVDGERAGTTPFEAEVVPGGAWVMVPRTYAAARGLRDARG